MAGISDLIEMAIKELLNNSEGEIILKRNEMANKYNCVPSQINYVISTRFNDKNGYYVESRRGGGGYILIRRAVFEGIKPHLMHIFGSVGNKVSEHSARMTIGNMLGSELLTEREAVILVAAVGDNALLGVPVEHKDTIRADILKNVLLSLMKKAE